MLEIVIYSLLNGLVYGLLLFLLASGLTLIFSLMGILNFAHASFYMLGAYIAYTIASYLDKINFGIFGIPLSGYWLGLIVAPIVVGILGALVERYGLRHVHKYGHVPELIFTFSLAFVFEEFVSFIWGRDVKPYNVHIPTSLDTTLLTVANSPFTAYKVFMFSVSVVIFVCLVMVLRSTRIGLIIQAAITHPQTVGMLGHNVPRIFMLVFGVGTALAGVAGVIAGPMLTTSPAMGFELGSIIFVIVVFGGLGSLSGAFIASLIIGVVQTFAVAFDGSLAVLSGVDFPQGHFLHDVWTLKLPQIAPLLPYLMMVLILIIRPYGLMGKREA